MSDKKQKIETLLALLDEPSRQAGSLIMAELLEFDHELDEYLAELQESDDLLVRQRVHQLESILYLRERRREFADKLRNDSLDMLSGLIEVHLQWYDNDTPEAIRKEWKKVLGEAEKDSSANIEKTAYFMRKMGFTLPPPNDLQADYYCLGIVLEEFVGADVILCAIAQMFAKDLGFELKIIQMIDNFALIDSSKRVLTPKDGWRVHSPLKEESSYKVWDTRTVLKFAASMLFLCAVSTDSFRYVNTIGKCLAKICGEDNIDFLPFPYNQVPSRNHGE